MKGFEMQFCPGEWTKSAATLEMTDPCFWLGRLICQIYCHIQGKCVITLMSCKRRVGIHFFISILRLDTLMPSHLPRALVMFIQRFGELPRGHWHDALSCYSTGRAQPVLFELQNGCLVNHWG